MRHFKSMFLHRPTLSERHVYADKNARIPVCDGYFDRSVRKNGPGKRMVCE